MADDLGTDGLENQAKGAAKEVGGKVRNAVGGLTGDTSEQLKGKAARWKARHSGRSVRPRKTSTATPDRIRARDEGAGATRATAPSSFLHRALSDPSRAIQQKLIVSCAIANPGVTRA